MLIKISLFALLTFASISGVANFNEFQKILNSHLTVITLKDGGLQSNFDYQGAKTSEATQESLKLQIAALKKIKIKTLDKKNDAKAFWINAYNFFMVKIILEKGFNGNKLEIKSVKDLGSFFSPYKIFTKKINQIGNENYSLDQIEKQILLGEDYKQKGWKDARIHFAVNCASVGCPPLIKTIYTSETIDRTLNKNIKAALLTPRHFQISGSTLKLTHLFKWYKKDFVEAEGSIKGFLKKYKADSKIQADIDATKNIEFIEYNWNLNSPTNFK